MSVSNFFKKNTTKYMNHFKKNPEEMAVSYAIILAGYCLATTGLIIAIREIEKQDNIISNMEFAIAKHNAYLEGLCDASKHSDSWENQNQWR